MKVRIGGVPEHFNFLWHYAISKGYFSEAGIELIWEDYPGGTGAMCKALKENALDLALLLTEGGIKEIASGSDFKIAKPYVETPLIWGIHTSEKNEIANLKELHKMKYAISRFGSGSHLMAFVHAKEHGILLRNEQMVIVGDLKGAREALDKNEADLFFWERFMTKPYVDSGEMKLLGLFPTPWPCFMLVSRNDFHEENKNTVVKIGEIVDKVVGKLEQDEKLEKHIATHYHLSESDVRDWYANTKWSKGNQISKKDVSMVLESLISLGMIQGQPKINQLVHNSITLN